MTSYLNTVINAIFNAVNIYKTIIIRNANKNVIISLNVIINASKNALNFVFVNFNVLIIVHINNVAIYVLKDVFLVYNNVIISVIILNAVNYVLKFVISINVIRNVKNY